MEKLRKLILQSLTQQAKPSCSCGCNTCDKAPILNESKQYDYPISVQMRYHIENKIPLYKSKCPAGSLQHNLLLKEAKILQEKGIIELKDKDLKLIKEGSESKLYKIEGLLVTNKDIKTQSQILSDIRALSGITIVRNEEYNPVSPKPNYEYNYTTIKIDPYPYMERNGKFDIEDIKNIIANINNMRGVVRFKAEPQLINIGI